MLTAESLAAERGTTRLVSRWRLQAVATVRLCSSCVARDSRRRGLSIARQSHGVIQVAARLSLEDIPYK